MSSEWASWEAVRAGLDDYRPKELMVRLAGLFEKGVPAENGPAREAVIRRTEEVLAAHAGGWYGGSPVRLGDEVFNGYCFCCCFFRPDAGTGVAANIERILAVLGAGHGWLRALGPHMRRLGRPGDDAAAARSRLAEAVREVVGVTAQATECNEAWYHCAEIAILWLVESQGLQLTAEVRAAVSAALAGFTSWVGPTPEQAAGAADAVAFAAVREELRQRYGGG